MEKTKTRERIPQSVRFNVFRRDNFTCRYCGRSSPQVVLHCDHSISVKDGGADTEDNLVTSCSDCNFGKSSQSIKRDPLPAAEKQDASLGLIGMWGHTFITNELGERDIEWQFKIVRQVSPDLYLCQLFSWMTGDPTNCAPIKTESLLNECKLYASNALMQEAYDKFYRQAAQLRRIRRV